MSFFWRTVGARRNSWSAGSSCVSGFNTVKTNSNFARNRNKDFLSVTSFPHRCNLKLRFLVYKDAPEACNISEGMNHHHLRGGGQNQSERSDRPEVRGSECAAS